MPSHHGHSIHGLDIVGADDAMKMALSSVPAGAMPQFLANVQSGMPPQAAAQACAPGAGAQAVWTPPGPPRRQIAPLQTQTIGPAASVTFFVQVQRGFRVDRLVLVSDTTPALTRVLSVNVGQEPQFVNQGDVPVPAFSPLAVDVYLKGDTAWPGVTLSVTVTNFGAAAEIIGGMFIGEAMKT